MRPASAVRSRKPVDPAVLAAVGGGLIASAGAALMLSAFLGAPFPRLAAVEEGRAAALLDSARPSRADVAAAREAALEALGRSPTRAVAWLELAYADTLSAGRLTPRALSALHRSYVFEPLGPDVTEWRLLFAFEHWDELTGDLRASALTELEAHWKREERRRAIAEWPERIGNPAGRVAAALTVRRLQRETAGR